MTTTSNHNPYQPPKADVTPPVLEFESGELIPNGQTVPAGNTFQWIGEGLKLFGKSPGMWILNMLILFFLSIVVALIPILGSIATNLLAPVIVAGILIGCRSLEAGDSLRVDHLFAGFKERAGQLILIGVLTFVAAMIVFIVLFILALVFLGVGFLDLVGNQQAAATWFLEKGWLMVLVFVLAAMALFVPLAMANWYAPALVVFHGMDAFPAMKSSFLGCLRNFLPFLLYGIVMFFLMIVAIIPIGLGLLVFVPMMYGSLYASYKDIFLKSE